MTARRPPIEYPELMTPGEVAKVLRVATRTVAWWRESGRIPADMIVTTPGGTARYRAEWVTAMLAGDAS